MAYNTGATFYPGGEDSYYMPEVVSPAPQRLAEAPINIEQNVAHMEQQAALRLPSRISTQSIQTIASPPSSNHGPWSPVSPSHDPYTQQQPINAGQQSSTYPNQYGQSISNQLPPPLADQPSFSPFPTVRNRGAHVPPTDEEREAILESAREAVLASDDFEVQLTWAQDTLAHVEISIQNEQRISLTQPSRPRTPRVEHMLREDAMKVVGFLADQHHPRAEFMRGTWLEFGKFGHRVDKREAFNCYSRASERGYSRAYYRIGMQFENSSDALKAIKYYQYGVDRGDAASCYRLGMMTLLGQHGQMQDFQRGLQLIRISSDGADENAPQGAYVLGMLQAGELEQVTIPDYIAPKDIASARANIERAAFLGFPKAQLRMGSAYEVGDLGCKFDAALSLHYNALAARQGEAQAEMAISKWFLCGQEGVFVKNEELSFTYAQRAALDGLSTAQFAMGYFYEVGVYVQMDLKQAREWYQKAQESGNSDAGKRINDISRSKTISRKDHERVALQKIRQEHGDSNATQPYQTTQTAPTLPTIQHLQSQTIDMPDPSRLTLNPTNHPPRSSSTAPYPTDGHGLLPQIRPTSAFGINPNLRSHSAVPIQGQRPEAQRISSAPVPQQRYYPNSGQQSPGPGHGRGGRPPVVGSNQQYGSSPRPQTSSYTNSQGHSGQNPPFQSQSPQTVPTLPMIDIGFSAPLDEPAKRRPVPSQQRPPPKQAAQQPSSGKYNQPNPAQLKPPRKDSVPSNPPKQENIRPANIEPSRPPRSGATTPQPAQQSPAKVSASVAQVSVPGKGPKTFEEMGVPQAKKESDCIVM